MTNQKTVQVKQYFCFSCGVEITFKQKEFRKNKYGKSVNKPFNVDGTEHFCKPEDKENYKNSDEYKQKNEKRSNDKENKYWRHFWGYGKGAEYKKYDTTEEKKERRKNSRQKREQYKQQYHNDSMTTDKAIEILELAKDILTKSKSEILQAVKLAYRKLALRFHPDRNKTPEASTKFIEATEAYEYLGAIINQ